MQNGRRIAFDFGDVRIGVAVSDLSGLLATPLENIANVESTLMAQLETLLLEYQPIYLVVGSPLHLSGQVSAKGESVQTFAQTLSSMTKAPIYLIDERLTTVSAARSIKQTGKNTREAKSLIDGLAAAMILESALNQERLHGAPMNRYL